MKLKENQKENAHLLAIVANLLAKIKSLEDTLQTTKPTLKSIYSNLQTTIKMFSGLR